MSGKAPAESAVALPVMFSRMEDCVIDITGAADAADAADAETPAVPVPITRQINVINSFFNLLTSWGADFEADHALSHMNT
jgi:hypothetical protein